MKLTELLTVLHERQDVYIYNVETEQDVYLGLVKNMKLDKDYEVVIVANSVVYEMAIDVKELE